jgi:hypothetical protein
MRPSVCTAIKEFQGQHCFQVVEVIRVAASSSRSDMYCSSTFHVWLLSYSRYCPLLIHLATSTQSFVDNNSRVESGDW